MGNLEYRKQRLLQNLARKSKHLSRLREDLEEIKNLDRDYNLDFTSAVSKVVSYFGYRKDISTPISERRSNASAEENPGSQHEPDSSDNKDEDREISEKSETSAKKSPSWMRKLFRSITAEIHPDKIPLDHPDRIRLVGLFNRSRKAVEKHDGDELIEVANELGLDCDIPIDGRIKSVEKRISDLEQEIKSNTSTIMWAWGEGYGNHALRTKVLRDVLSNAGYTDMTDEEIKMFVELYENGEEIIPLEKTRRRPKNRRLKPGERPKKL